MRALLYSAMAGVVMTSAAFGWGSDGHRMITTVAVQHLPDEIPAFLRTPEAAAEAGFLGPEPDRERDAGKSFDDEHSPGHFVDVDDDLKINGGPSLKALPVSREKYDDALRATGTNQYKMGYLPYSIQQGFELLSKDFGYWRVLSYAEKNAKTAADRARYAKERVWREHVILHDLGIWSHYVADGSMPMHASIHFNGWGKGPNPEGFTAEKIHSLFETGYVHGHLAEKDVAAVLPAYRDCKCAIAERTADYLAADQAAVVPLYQLEKKTGFKAPSAEADAFVTARLAAGAAELRDMIVDAWRHAAEEGVGYPPKKVSDIEAGKIDPAEAMKD
jgi:hypothetical protein